MFKTLVDYFLKTRPLSFEVWGEVFLFSIIITLVYGIFGNLVIKKLPIFQRKLARRLKTLSLYYGFISLGFYLVRIERIPYLSMRIWLWLWFLGFWVSVVLIVLQELKKIPARHQQQQAELKRKRYFEN